MKLQSNKIHSIDSWFNEAPPMGGKRQWRDGRSAKELARFITNQFPHMPNELEHFLINFTDCDAQFAFFAEYITNLANYNLGRGEGRNHDALLVGNNIVVGIEGKADEAFGSQYVSEAYNKGSENKKHRIRGMLKMLLGENAAAENYPAMRYQLLTASAAVLLEAKRQNAETAVFIIIVFKKKGCYSEVKAQQNEQDIQAFLNYVAAIDCGNYHRIDTHYGKEHNIRLYFGEIVIDL